MSPDYRARRERVIASIGSGAMIVPSAPLAIRNNDVEHEYRQDSDLHYLTGYDEPESVLVLRSPAPRVVLFVRPRDPEREVWDGRRAGVEGAVRDFGADEAHVIGELDEKLPTLLENVPRLFHTLGRDRKFDDSVLSALKRVRARAKFGVTWPTEVVEHGTIVHELRAKKDAAELALMRRAVDVTAEAHRAAMAATKPGMYEYEVDGLMRGIFRRAGAERCAYEPIVGSGPNATVLHYRNNDRQMQDGDLLLIDAGCEFGYYASDVTRTFPVNGRFSNAQRALYELVLAAQDASVAATKPGATLTQVHDASVRVLAQGMLELGLLSGSMEEVLETESYKRFYMHRTSHWLGMDVHDVGLYYQQGEPRPLEAGMVITIEPGIYVAGDAQGVDERFRGIGIRIEDDVLVTADGHDVLSRDIPKTVADVERACAA